MDSPTDRCKLKGETEGVAAVTLPAIGRAALRGWPRQWEPGRLASVGP
jgi:hypothetical protein